VSESRPNSNPPPQGGQGGAGGNGGQRRRRRPSRSGQGGPNRPQSDRPQNANPNQQLLPQGQNPNQQRGPNDGHGSRSQSDRSQGQGGGNRSRSRNSRVLTTNQVLVKYDNLLEQHLITRRKYYDYFNRVDDRQLRRLERNFSDSIEHLRRFEASLEPWQREALEKRKTERYRPDLTYSNNRGWNPEEIAKADFQPDENEDPHFKESQKEAFNEYRDDMEESEGTFEDYLKLKGQA
jgi:hypothetical protein